MRVSTRLAVFCRHEPVLLEVALVRCQCDDDLATARARVSLRA